MKIKYILLLTLLAVALTACGDKSTTKKEDVGTTNINTMTDALVSEETQSVTEDEQHTEEVTTETSETTTTSESESTKPETEKPDTTKPESTKPETTTSEPTTEAKQPEKVWVVDKEAWTESVWVVDKPASTTEVWVVDQAAWTETKEVRVCQCNVCGQVWSGDICQGDTWLNTWNNHIGWDITNLDDPCFTAGYMCWYEQQVIANHPEQGHYETQTVPEQGHWETIEHPEEGHWETR